MPDDVLNAAVETIAAIHTILFFAAAPALFGGLIGEILYGGRLVIAQRKHADPSPMAGPHLHLWVLGWIFLLRRTPTRGAVEALGRSDVGVAGDIRKYVVCRRVVRYALVALVVAYLISGATKT